MLVVLKIKYKCSISVVIMLIHLYLYAIKRVANKLNIILFKKFYKPVPIWDGENLI